MELASLTRLLGRRPARRRPVEPLGPLPPHRFDCEAELLHAPFPPALDGNGLHWWQTEYGRWRFEAEAKAMRRFPGFEPRLSPDGLLRWEGWLTSALRGGRRYLVHISYPSSFPDEAPRVSIPYPELPTEGVPHLLAAQRPCLYRSDYDPARTTSATLVAWTALWIHAFETWRATGSWPGAEA